MMSEISPAWCYQLEGNYTSSAWQRKLAEAAAWSPCRSRIEKPGAERDFSELKMSLLSLGDLSTSGRGIVRSCSWAWGGPVSVIPFLLRYSGQRWRNWGCGVKCFVSWSSLQVQPSGPCVASVWNLSTGLFFCVNCKEVSHWALFSRCLVPEQNKTLVGNHSTGFIYHLMYLFVCNNPWHHLCFVLAAAKEEENWQVVPYQPCQIAKCDGHLAALSSHQTDPGYGYSSASLVVSFI